MDSKPFWQSKTVWVNTLTALAAFLALPQLQEILGPDSLKYVVLAQAAINVGLRVITIGAVTNPVADWFKK